MTPSNTEFQRLIRQWSEAAEQGDLERAGKVAGEVLSRVGDGVEWEDDHDLRFAAMAADCESRGDWAGAEDAYREALRLADGPLLRWKAHDDLRALYALLGRQTEAHEQCLLGLEAARRSDSDVTLAMALGCAAKSYLQRGDVPAAIERVGEAIDLLPDGEKLQEHLVASNCVLRAEIALQTGDIEAAERDVTHAQEILHRWADDPIAAGPLSDLAQCCRVAALLCEARGDVPSARESWKSAIAFARKVAGMPHVAGVYSAARVMHLLEEQAAFFERSGYWWRARLSLRRARRLRRGLRVPGV